MARVSKEEMERRLDDTERHLISLGRSGQVQTLLSRKYGTNRRTVRKWIAVVRARWAEEAKKEEEELGISLREQRRMQIREMLLDIYGQARNRQQVVRDAKGDPVIVRDDSGRGKPMTIPHPNDGAALQAIKQLRHLHALDDPKVHHINDVTGSVQDPTAKRTAAEDIFFLKKGRYPTKAELAELQKARTEE